MNRNKDGETGRSECEVTKTRYLEAEELREIWDLSWKSSFQTKLLSPLLSKSPQYQHSGSGPVPVLGLLGTRPTQKEVSCRSVSEASSVL